MGSQNAKHFFQFLKNAVVKIGMSKYVLCLFLPFQRANNIYKKFKSNAYMEPFLKTQS